MRILLSLVCLALLVGCAGVKPDRAKRVFALQERAEVLYQQGDFARALPEYQALLATLPSSTHGWLRLGNCHAQLEQYPDAVLAYQRALVLDSDFASAWINLAYVQSRMLSQTVADMYQHVSKDDPQARRVQALVDGVLSPFAAKAQANEQPGQQVAPSLRSTAIQESAVQSQAKSAPSKSSEPGAGDNTSQRLGDS